MKISRIASKKFSAALTVTAFAAVLALTGCAAQGTSDDVSHKLDSIESRLDEMGERLDKLDGQDAVVYGDAELQDEALTAENLTKADFDARIAELEKEVDTAITNTENAQVPDKQEDRPSAYYEVVEPLKKLDDKLDRFENSLERAHRDGSLTPEEFWALEKAKDQLEDKLDKAEDSLELRMGVDE